ncbi:hypothetical protein SCA6_019636 [Theobroma cacao]
MQGFIVPKRTGTRGIQSVKAQLLGKGLKLSYMGGKRFLNLAEFRYLNHGAGLHSKPRVAFIVIDLAALDQTYHIPRRYEALWKELDSLKQFLKTKDAWSMENASVAALFGVECYAWSWGGEIIGRGFTLTGYYV